MARFIRVRSIIYRYAIFSILIMTTIKLTSVFYDDLQNRSSEQLSSSLPFVGDRNFNATDNAQIMKPINRTEIENLRRFVTQKNDEQIMHNQHLFYPTKTRYILLVQVHKRHDYLRKFIETLRLVENINQTLLIFSHDFIDPDINVLVGNITFVPVIQIFYPFSQQLYPDEFPGLDPNDCPRNLERHKALESRCNNAPYPDRYGHYREVSVVQIKHHWWWKLNFVFNSIRQLHNRTDFLTVLLEEDFYLSPDALNFLENMEAAKKLHCPDCMFYTLGNLEKTGQNFEKLGSKVSVAYWHARYNLGMTISYEVWRLLVKYAEEFCNIDDYNWDWSMVYLAQSYLNFPRVMWSSATRVFHLGSCGTHHKKTCVNESNVVRWQETEKFYTQNQKYLFPKAPLSIHMHYLGKRLLKQPNGGWSDLRDRQLCLSFAGIPNNQTAKL